ncbi:MAG: DNA repair protein RecN [Spongiibacteraceae bacterium]|nr:DNA repair protein RecN [Spongiibacteraceae bacterium]MBN51798.1 DNA repair protein RecN [Spongiibacteraceae bacterium]
MLTQLCIRNYAIAESLDIDLENGMTALTGETGAGKSIMLDALGLALGDRADAGIVRHGTDKAEINALFDVSAVPAALSWLQSRDLDAGDDCMLRRVITAEGRSRAYINGQPATLQDIRNLSDQLIDIHSQHEHQSLLKKDYQRQLLDTCANAQALAEKVEETAHAHQRTLTTLSSLSGQRDEQSARAQLLQYQLDELETLNLQASEVESLEDEQKQLANAEQLLAASDHALNLCKDGEVNALGILHQALSSLRASPVKVDRQASAEELLKTAVIQIEEASRELQHHLDREELDPARLHEVQERLDSIYQIARKHHCKPEQLPELQARLQSELDSIQGSDERLEQLKAELETLAADYHKSAGKLSEKRRKAAATISKKVEAQLAELSMANCRFNIALNSIDSSEHLPGHGLEDVSFLISTNPGSQPGPLNKIASGGELSRISLAIHVVNAQAVTVPTIVFDEVDVGIGGATAEVVGGLLQALGKTTQVLCVTHQPQVASQADHHIKVSKQSDKKSVKTALHQLGENEKIDEIARMLGGIAITENTLAHAREMVTTAH